MMVIKFKSSGEHEDLMKKIKKMKKFTEELEYMLEDCYDEDDYSFRKGYRKDYDDEEMRMEGRYGYRRGGSR